MTSQSEGSLVPPVTEDAIASRLTNDRRGLAGDRGLIDRGDALDHLTIPGDEITGVDQHDVTDRERR